MFGIPIPSSVAPVAHVSILNRICFRKVSNFPSRPEFLLGPIRLAQLLSLSFRIPSSAPSFFLWLFVSPFLVFLSVMRFLRVLPALGLLFGARASQLDSRVPHTLDTRDLLDVCADIKVDLIVPNLLNILKAAGLVGASTFYSKNIHM